MSRITMNNLNSLLTTLNNETGRTYTIANAYGGQRLSNEFGSKDILNTGYVSKKVLYDCMLSFYKGVIVGKELTSNLEE